MRRTRILPDAIVGSCDLGETIEELREGFAALSLEQIKRLVEFAHAQRGQTFRNGIPQLPIQPGAGISTPELIRQLMDELP